MTTAAITYDENDKNYTMKFFNNEEIYKLRVFSSLRKANNYAVKNNITITELPVGIQLYNFS